jgi:hypothetical protein
MKTPSDRTLERYLLGELSGEQEGEVDRALREDPGAASRLEALRRSDAEILERYPPAMMAARFHERLAAGQRPESRRRGRSFAFALPGAALALLLVLLVPPYLADTTRIKGLDSRLALHRKAAAGVELLSDGAAVAAGDVIQISYVAGGARYAAILSIDGDGAVTWHLPGAYAPRARAVAVEPGGEVALGFAYELDNAPAFERFFLVTSDKPFTLDAVAAEAARLAADPAAARRQPLRLARGLGQSTFLLVKEARR